MQAAEIEQEFKKPKSKKSVSLGDGSDQESDDDLELQKYDEKEVVVNDDDDLAIKMFMNRAPGRTRTLADIINDKITEKKTEIDTQFTDDTQIAKDLDPKVTEMYTIKSKLG